MKLFSKEEFYHFWFRLYSNTKKFNLQVDKRKKVKQQEKK